MTQENINKQELDKIQDRAFFDLVQRSNYILNEFIKTSCEENKLTYKEARNYLISAQKHIVAALTYLEP